jgi:hypothetical protein
MSQRRRRIRRKATPIGPSTHDKRVAALGAAAVLGFTALAVWALRPGGPHPNDFEHTLTGGIGNRQPKVTWLVVFAIAAVVGVVYFVRTQAQTRAAAQLRHGHAPRETDPRRWQVIGAIAVLGVSVLAGWFMPGGLLYHYDPPKLTDDELVPPDLDTTVPVTTLPLTPLTTATTVPTATTGSTATTGPETSGAPTTTAAAPEG